MTTPDDANHGRVIRAAEVRDIPAVLELWRDAAEEPTATDDPDGLRALLERDGQALLLAIEGGEIAGTLIAGWDGWRGNLYRLAVRPSHRRRGIATDLVRAAEDRFGVLGVRRVHAGVVGGHPTAISFWKAVGYAFDERIARYRKNAPPR